MKKKEKSRNKNPKMKYSRFGVMLVVFLAVLILIVNIISASYSWFSPDSVYGSGMTFVQSDYMRSEQCSFKLYQGEVKSSGIDYDVQVLSTGTASDTLVTSTTATLTSSADVTEDLHYYRIEVQNEDTENASDISLYFTNVPAGTTIGIVKPTNSTHTYSDATNDVNIVRNAYVKKYLSTDVDPGILYVEFFIRCTGSSFTFDETDIYLLYN